MSTKAPVTTFVAAGTVTINPPAGLVKTFALPTVDGSNTSLTVTNNCSTVVFVQIGTVANMPAGPTVPGSIALKPAETTLLTAGAQGTATFVAVFSPVPGSLVFKRGTSAAASAFASSDDAVRV